MMNPREYEAGSKLINRLGQSVKSIDAVLRRGNDGNGGAGGVVAPA